MRFADLEDRAALATPPGVDVSVTGRVERVSIASSVVFGGATLDGVARALEVIEIESRDLDRDVEGPKSVS